MKIINIKEPAEFFDKVLEVKGTVELITSEGDRLNLKSKLCQYIALTQMFEEGHMGEVELILSEPDELSKIQQYLVAL